MLAHTYKWSHKQITSLSARQFFKYYGQISFIEARQQMLAFEVSAYPHLKEHDRRRVFRRYEHLLEEPKPPSPKQIEESWEYLRLRRQTEKERSKAK